MNVISLFLINVFEKKLFDAYVYQLITKKVFTEF